jgi:hypothetical protein
MMDVQGDVGSVTLERNYIMPTSNFVEWKCVQYKGKMSKSGQVVQKAIVTDKSTS